MSLGELVIIAVGGVLLVVMGLRLARKLFSATARQERRRRRNHSRVTTKVARPMVKFSVKTPKRRRK
ncbi:MAG: hypothetical protein M9920_03815 [Verrucomicrobiae bacterium]|nr:hypothetical protein [Verrucomicrobiae bacterium]